MDEFWMSDNKGIFHPKSYRQSQIDELLINMGYKFVSEEINVCGSHQNNSCCEANSITLFNLVCFFCDNKPYGHYGKQNVLYLGPGPPMIVDQMEGSCCYSCLPKDYESCVPCKLLCCPLCCNRGKCTKRRYSKSIRPSSNAV